MNNSKNVIQLTRKIIPGLSVLIIFLIVFVFTVRSSRACSTFVLKYGKQIVFGKNLDWFTGKKPFSSSPSSLDRFARIAKMIKDYQSNPSKAIVPYAFDILSSVSQGKATVWSIVYDIEKFQITYRTFENNKLKTIRLSDFDFDCNTPSKSLDINNDFEGNIATRFVEYSTDMNIKLVKSTFDQYKKGDFLGDTPEDFLESLARYPDTLKCAKGKDKS